MKRLTLSLSVAFLTCLAGIAATWGYQRIPPLFFAEQALTSRAIEAQPKGDLEVELLHFTETEYGTYAQFEVTNGGSEKAYYPGYGKNSHCADMVRQGRKIELSSFCWCGTGLEEQTLEPGESVKFDVQIPKAKETFEVGFDFSVGERRLKRTIWSRSLER